ncbi:ABC transporter ATP-binding protein [Clostridium brassicae]|uniref:ABC transporter ATP-binding protein n=1 Tax=Clostridium brassicae TaxID=2999072 RepID=A0ABT4DDR8_9CLOT|nr:ABC transporter ATP-binding protein [Clostridium brassicae]MCY6960464.1 ABC transporter ATP-binding protein [Clostridium brassicae]
MKQTTPIIELNSIRKIYGKGDSAVNALRNVNISINKGEMLAIMGPSGSGKSTLLNIMGLLDDLTEGNYKLFGSSVKGISSKDKASLRNMKLGFIVQDFALVEKYTVEQNIEIPFAYLKKRISKEEKNEKIKEVLKKLDIESKRYELVCNLSGGQRQRVSIARAIINEPEIILADEPTGSLDSKTAKEIINVLKELNNRGKTVVIITHDKNIAESCNRMINIKDGIII